MPKRERCDGLIDSCLIGVALENLPEALTRHAGTADVDK